MAARAVPVVRVDYPKLWFIVGTVALAAATAYAAWSACVSIEDFGTMFWTGTAIVAGALMGLLFLPPIFTSHMLGAREIRLRMGLLMNVAVPYEWVTDVRATTVKRGTLGFGLGVRYSSILSTVFALSATEGLIALRLDSDHDLGGLLRPRVSQVVLSVRDPEGVMSVIRQRSAEAREKA